MPMEICIDSRTAVVLLCVSSVCLRCGRLDMTCPWLRRLISNPPEFTTTLAYTRHSCLISVHTHRTPAAGNLEKPAHM